ncbi:hypothetical protein [Cyclobacterium amurskyense]|nr:hypothetical protein [Cyclobacterium amurskyense]
MMAYPFLLRLDKIIVEIRIGLWATAQTPSGPSRHITLMNIYGDLLMI